MRSRRIRGGWGMRIVLNVCNIFLVLSLSSPNPPSQKRRQESLHVGNNPLLSLNLNLDALTRAAATDRAQELYSRIFALYEEGYYATAPDIVSFNTVLKGLQDHPAKAVAFWEQEISTRSSDDAPPRLVPNTRSYNTILLALARAGLHTECLEILKLMKDDATPIWPDRITYNTVLHSYASSKDDDAPLLAETLLEEMIRESADDSETDMPKGVSPDVISYNTVLTCWAQRGEAEKAQAWLDRLRGDKHLRADVYSFTTVMRAWAENGVVDQALQLLEEMKAQPSAHSFPNKLTYTALVRALCQKERVEEAHDVLQRMWESSHETQPDVVTYSVLLEGWARVASKRPKEAIDAVGKILQEMRQRGDPNVEPNEITYTNALKVLAASVNSHAVARAHDLVKSMKNPTVYHYNALLNVYSKSDRKDKIQCCIRIWKEEMGTNVKADKITYNTLLGVLSGAYGEPSWRHRCLVDGLKVYEEFEMLAKNVLQGEPVNNEKAIEIYLPSSVTFSFLVRLVRRCGISLSPEDRQTWFRRILRGCGPQYGCLNIPVWKQMIEAVVPFADEQDQSVELYLGLSYLLGEDTTQPKRIEFQDLPDTWSRRALPDRRRLKKNDGNKAGDAETKDKKETSNKVN
eukprot:scaffold2413_cov171-Amphora_coffeaeformis.AAC.12